jgi:uncharacterized protein YxjI
MLERNTFVVKEKAKMLSSRNSYEILDEAGAVIGTAEQKTSALAMLLGMALGEPSTQIDFREKPDDSLVFTVRRRGFPFKKVEVVDAQGALIGRYKAKMLSLSGGFHVYDKDDKYFARVKGRLLGFDYRFLTEDDKVELGQVSKVIGGAAGVARELFFSADHYYLKINPELAEQPMAKMLLLAATLAVDLIYKSQSQGGIGDFADGGE